MYLNKYNLKNKIALVTGAGKGLGKACAIALAEAGSNLVIISRTKKDLDIYTCYADNGIGVIFNRPNRNILNIEREDFSKMKFSEYYNNYKEYMNLIFYEELFKIL